MADDCTRLILDTLAHIEHDLVRFLDIERAAGRLELLHHTELVRLLRLQIECAETMTYDLGGDEAGSANGG